MERVKKEVSRLIQEWCDANVKDGRECAMIIENPCRAFESFHTFFLENRTEARSPEQGQQFNSNWAPN